MTAYRVGYTGSGWQAERSPDGLRPEPFGPVFPGDAAGARAARALVDSLTGELSPLRSAPDDSPRPGPSGAATLPPFADELGHVG